MVNNILEHLMANADYYTQFHTVDLLWDTEDCFKFGNYCDSIMDVIIVSSVKALHMNLSFYQKQPHGNIQVIEHTTDFSQTSSLYIYTHRTPKIQLKTSMMPFCCLTSLVSYWIKTDPVQTGNRLWYNYITMR